MSRLKQRSEKAGLAPGTAVHVGEQKIKAARVLLTEYDPVTFREIEGASLEECLLSVERSELTWIDIKGLHEVEIIEKLGLGLNIHPLIIEDILNTHQRPKVDHFDDYIYIVVRFHDFDEKTKKLEADQISLLVGNGYVITFQEKESSLFTAVRKRMKNDKGRIRKKGADYLAYALLDDIVDSYFGVLENMGDAIEDIEESLANDPLKETIHSIHSLKREAITLRKSLWPLREIVGSLLREDSRIFGESMDIFLRDLHDHTIQVIETVETYRDIISGMIDIYLSSVSNRMNEVMKVLTIFAAIFIPLTFIAGIYGMNFNSEKSPFNMPELNWYFGYPLALGLMVTVGVVMLLFFRRKKWL